MDKQKCEYCDKQAWDIWVLCEECMNKYWEDEHNCTYPGSDYYDARYSF